ncbi:hypothetical protein SAMN05443377_12321 [Propionibacterium cyclohexanicum]|uniref:Uncharacterized protein n=1 Tax=Propionibacterium cyclohexanicum TaxID=64702 RepID=A0A1H9THB9_9ACTN|nr:hypothetical protein [Propionibacterium cyclohexanicum]SER96605.1 hypothetical protein SAMN05443377_12321 [Propionibacterium cyclohexanicum]
MSGSNEGSAPDSRRTREQTARTQLHMQEEAARREAVSAQKLIDDFVVAARERGLEPQPLMAKLLSGGTVKTDKKGWYIKRSHTIAVGEDGGYYVLTVPGGLLARWRGVELHRAQPSLQVSRGGRDGETGDLAEFLQRTLDGENL